MNHTAFQAEEYDRKIRQTLPYYEDFYEQITEILTVLAKTEVSWLDIGCGTGKMYEAAQRKIRIREFVFADISEKMLDIASHRFPAAENRFVKMAAQQLDAEAAYDVITAVQVHHYLSEEERKLAVGSCFRALKKNGIFFSFENIAPCSEEGRRIALQRWQRYQMARGKSQAEAESHLGRYGKEYFPITVEAQLKMMRSCGFQSVELIWASYMQAGFMGMKEEIHDTVQTLDNLQINDIISL